MHVARDVMDYHNGAGAMVAKRQSALTDVASLKALGNGTSIRFLITASTCGRRREMKKERGLCARDNMV